MNDREIYKEIAEILFSVAPNNKLEVHLFADYWPKQAVGISVWNGKYLSGDTSLSLPRAASDDLMNLISELGDYYIDNDLGKWNLMHYKLEAKGKGFNVDFEFKEELYNGDFIKWRYMEKFKAPKKHNKFINLATSWLDSLKRALR